MIILTADALDTLLFLRVASLASAARHTFFRHNHYRMAHNMMRWRMWVLHRRSSGTLEEGNLGWNLNQQVADRWLIQLRRAAILNK